MTEISIQQVPVLIRSVQDAYYKLVIIAGTSRSGKTRLLRQIADQLGLPLINLSLLMSQRLLSQTQRQRTLKAEEVAIEVIDEHLQSGLCLDDTELLFDSTLRLNPLVFLQEISRNRLIVASWNGALVGGELRFGDSCHPDFFTQAVSCYPVVTITDDKLQLFLTT